MIRHDDMNKILDTTKSVIDKADFVRINKERINQFSKEFNHGDAKHWLSESPFDFTKFNEEEKLRFLILFNALSFSYWSDPKWSIEYKGNILDGSWGLIASLGRAIEKGVELINFEYCATITRADFSKIVDGATEIPLLEERWKILNEIGLKMISQFDGKASNLIAAAAEDTQKLLELLVTNFPSFKDTSLYKNDEIYFYKRAQLLIADIFQIFDGKSFGSFKNIDQITACADYKLPQILRKFGILEYEDSLARKIDSKIEIAHGSPEEIEIRASTIWAIEFIKEEVKKRQPQIMSFEINDHLWLATQEKFTDDKPYHRTRTTAY
jgi:hypothetical protein